MTLDEQKRMLGSYRGRRFLACNAADVLSKVVENIGLENGEDLPPPDRALPEPPTDAMRREIGNAVSLVLRMILAANDGGCSPQRLQRF